MSNHSALPFSHRPSVEETEGKLSEEILAEYQATASKVAVAIRASDDALETSLSLLTVLASFQLRVGVIRSREEAQQVEEEFVTFLRILRDALLG